MKNVMIHGKILMFHGILMANLLVVAINHTMFA